MSATATQQRLAKTTSWLAQLRVNAQYAGFTAAEVAQTAQERYGKPMDELTVTEAETLAWEYIDICRQKAAARRAQPSSEHRHYCASCSRPFHCKCNFLEEENAECSACHEGIAVRSIPNYDYSAERRVRW